MANKKMESAEQRRKDMAEELWLLYFNRTLLAAGLITERQHNRMTHLIHSRRPSATKKRAVDITSERRQK